MAWGHELSEVAGWGVVSGTIRSELREGKEAARQVANLVLFGAKADTEIKRDDTPIVQVLKELARTYRDAHTSGDLTLAQKTLRDISTTLSAHESRRGTRMDQAMKLMIEQAKIQLKMASQGLEAAPTSAELESILADSDAQAIKDAVEATSAAADRDDEG